MIQQKTGLAREYLTASYLVRYFDDVFETSESARYDFLCIKDNINYKIQTKTTDSKFERNNSHWLRWDIKKKISNKKNDYRVYSQDEVDIFAFVYLSLDKVLFIPNRNTGKTYQKKVSFIEQANTLETLKSSTEAIRDLKL